MNNRDWKINPPLYSPEYKSTILRSPAKPLIPVKHSLSELTGPAYGHNSLGELDHDLTKNAITNGEPLGERILVGGKVLDENGRPVSNTLVEIWQANSAGRYIHKVDQHNAPVDPNFFGGGRILTDGEGSYKFYTIRPGAYPWGNHDNAWRPSHIHFSLFGNNICTRLITQMYFPGDPLLPFDPIYNAIPEDGRELLISEFSLDLTEPGFSLGYKFDIVLRGKSSTPFENQ